MSVHVMRRLSVRLAPVTSRAADVAPVAPACCNVCRTCTTTNLVGLAVGGAGAVAAVASGFVKKRRAARPRTD